MTCLVLLAHPQRRSSSVIALRELLDPRAQLAISGSSSTSVAPPRRISAPWLPT
jgi:hypothetical protein